MKQLLKFEFRKLFRMKSLYICSAVIVLLTLFTFGALKIMEMIMTNGEIMSAVGITELSVTGMEFLNAKYCMVSALSGTDISILISIVVALLFCTDFSTGAIKNIVAKVLDIPAEEIDDNAHVMLDLGADSMQYFSILTALSNEFSVSNPEKGVLCYSVHEFCQYIERHI